MKFKHGDEVIIIDGFYKGKQGEIMIGMEFILGMIFGGFCVILGFIVRIFLDVRKKQQKNKVK